MICKFFALLLAGGIGVCASPVSAEQCLSYFSNNNINYKGDRSVAIRYYLSWNGSELFDCGSQSDLAVTEGFSCGGRFFGAGGASVRDTKGTHWPITWRKMADTTECSKVSDVVYANKNVERYTGIVKSADISLGLIVTHVNLYQLVKSSF